MNLSVIVCPVDFSLSGEAALRRGLALAQWHEAELHVLYVRPGRARKILAGKTSAEDPLLGRLAEFISTVDSEGVAITPVVLAGDPVKAVAEYARAKSADLVVVGQNGRRGSRFWTSGVLATEVARAVAAPTLTVSEKLMPRTDERALFNNILCAIDFSAESLLALKKALALAQEGGGRITLLHALEGFPYETVYSGSRALRLVGEYRAHVDVVRRKLRALVPVDAFNWCEVETEVVSGPAADAIVATARELKADLVVMGRPRRTGFDRIKMASTMSAVLRRATSPVLAVPGTSSFNAVERKSFELDRHDGETTVALPQGGAADVAPGHSRRMEALQ